MTEELFANGREIGSLMQAHFACALRSTDWSQTLLSLIAQLAEQEDGR
ncbi:hypothetical protein [Argonema galeatum]|nr:hypothetical protein [Argonema galeatum]MCL1462942.1 hypothetical protein [Argonema galeatum A003/A1]